MQLKLILESLGKPEFEDTNFIDKEKLKNYFRFVMPEREPLQWSAVLPALDQRLGKIMASAALDLIDQMLRFNPSKRTSARKALQHPYFEGASRSVEPEHRCIDPMNTIPDDLSSQDILQQLYKEVSVASSVNDSHDIVT